MNGNKPVNLFGQSEAASSHNLSMDWNGEYLRRNVTDGDVNRTRSHSSVYPSGNYLKLGTAQMLALDERARTLIGSTSTLGISQNRGNENAALFVNAVKRWHFTLGMPSSAFFVDAGENPIVTAVREKYEDRSDGFVLMTAQVYALSDNGFTLEHHLEGSESFFLGSDEYALPDDFPPLVAVLHGKETSRDDLTTRQTH